jgi:ATP-binding cassette subfamily C (CFTR/MRP) protein 1
VLFIVGEAITVFSSWWLSYWSQNLSSGRSPWFYLGIYVVINVGVVLLTFAKEFYLRMRGLHASKSLFLELLQAVLFSPMGFFDTTPLGRIINRFSKDVYTVDEQLPQTVRAYIGTMARVFSTLAYIVVITPLFLVGLVPVFVFYYFAQRYYIKTSRELSRLESTSRSPIYALFSETLDGLSTIRAYGAEQRLIHKNDALLDTNVQSFFLNFSANCWLGVRLEFTGTLIVTFAALFAVLSRDTSDVSGPVNSTEHRQAFAGEDCMLWCAISLSFCLFLSLLSYLHLLYVHTATVCSSPYIPTTLSSSCTLIYCSLPYIPTILPSSSTLIYCSHLL